MKWCWPQRQAWARTQSGLPVTSGHAATHTHDYRRPGNLSLCAALDIHTGFSNRTVGPPA